MDARRKGHGFTLVELLVVIAIIGILVAMLLPAINSARESGRRTTCTNNMKQIGLAIINYTDTYNAYPAAYKNTPATGFFIYIFPFCDNNTIFEQYKLNLAWNSAKNEQAVQQDIPMLVCPSAPGNRHYISDYGVCTSMASNIYNPWIQEKKILPRSDYNGAIADPSLGVSTPAKVTDGLSHTFLFFEDGGRPGNYNAMKNLQTGTVSGSQWADPANEFAINDTADLTFNSFMNCTNNNEVFSFHPNGCNFLYGDGAVRFSVQTMNMDTYLSIFTRAASDNVYGPDCPF